MANNNDTFTTKDIDLAAYLFLNQAPLIDIIPLTPYLSRFVFQKPIDSILEIWDSRQAAGNIRTFCDAREKIVHQARERQAALPRGGGR